MGLNYNILWIDDRIDEFIDDGIGIKLEKFLEELFFVPHIDYCEDIEDAEEKVKSIKYDVIFSDNDISENEDGSKFINNIRAKNVNSEVLFYSGQKNPPIGKLDRVTYFFNSGINFHANLLSKMKDIIKLTIDKLNSLSSLRGLVMSEVSDLDEKMKAIVGKFSTNNPAESEFSSDDTVYKNTLHKYMVGLLEKRIKDNLIVEKDCGKKCTHKFRKIQIDKIIEKQDFDSSMKAKTIQFLCEKKLKKSSLFTYKDYYEEIIEKRNNLAHCTTSVKDGNEWLITNKGEDKFSAEDFKKLRQNIQKYSRLFDSLYSSIECKVRN